MEKSPQSHLPKDKSNALAMVEEDLTIEEMGFHDDRYGFDFIWFHSRFVFLIKIKTSISTLNCQSLL